MTEEYLIEQCRITNNQTLKGVLSGIMNEYARRFCEMYDFAEGWWVADDCLGVYCTDDIEVSIGASELVYCVDNEVDGDTFEEWWNHCLSSYNPDDLSEPKVPLINLRSWCKGARPEMINNK